IIDEAQNLSTEVLEQIRLLTNLETSTDKLLQIILIGQPELGDLLGLYEMRQLAQRITARYHLGALTRQETKNYIHHRLRICGGGGRLFEPRATNEVYRFSAGIPRLINILCDRALLGAYTENKSRVDIKTVRRAAYEIKTTTARSHGAAPSAVKNHAWRWAWVAVAVFAIGLVWLSRSDVADKWTAPVLQAATDDAPDIIMEKEVPNPVVDIENTKAPKPTLVKKIDTDNLVSSTVAATTDLGTFLLSLPSEARRQAGQALLVRWGIKKEQLGNGDVCSEAERYGLRCMKGKGGWSGLRNLDRPALLELVTASDQRVPVVLQVLDEVTAGIESGGMMRKIPIGILDQYWQGQYTILWRPPIRSSSLRLGDVGDDVPWLRARLQDILDTKETTANPAQFDAGLKEQVIRFQGIRGLEKDGIAGKRTLIHINTLTQGARVPRLFGGKA
ncbi:MAG: AAA family ATPase, partial [Gammaproteobacteria bacterium]